MCFVTLNITTNNINILMRHNLNVPFQVFIQSGVFNSSVDNWIKSSKKTFPWVPIGFLRNAWSKTSFVEPLTILCKGVYSAPVNFWKSNLISKTSNYRTSLVDYSLLGSTEIASLPFDRESHLLPFLKISIFSPAVNALYKVKTK